MFELESSYLILAQASDLKMSSMESDFNLKKRFHHQVEILVRSSNSEVWNYSEILDFNDEVFYLLRTPIGVSNNRFSNKLKAPFATRKTSELNKRYPKLDTHYETPICSARRAKIKFIFFQLSKFQVVSTGGDRCLKNSKSSNTFFEFLQILDRRFFAERRKKGFEWRAQLTRRSELVGGQLIVFEFAAII